MSHYLMLIPLRRSRRGATWTEVACWRDHFDAVALGCACGYQHRLLDPRGDLAVDAELDSSPHAAVMVPAFQDLTEPTVVPEDMGEHACA